MNALITLTPEADVRDELYTVTQLSRLFGVSRAAVHNWLNDGRFPNSFEVGEGGGRMVLIPHPDVVNVREQEAQELVKQLEQLGYTVTITLAE
jgi:predicted DNA-binding transcriptional regulator AlpA